MNLTDEELNTLKTLCEKAKGVATVESFSDDAEPIVRYVLAAACAAPRLIAEIEEARKPRSAYRIKHDGQVEFLT